MPRNWLLSVAVESPGSPFGALKKNVPPHVGEGREHLPESVDEAPAPERFDGTTRIGARCPLQALAPVGKGVDVGALARQAGEVGGGGEFAAEDRLGREDLIVDDRVDDRLLD